MIEVRKSTKNPTMTAIRAASGRELSMYEKCKLERIEENAQEKLQDTDCTIVGSEQFFA